MKSLSISYITKIAIVSILSIVAIALFGTSAIAQGGSGSIWTTTGTCGDPQNINQYAVGETVFINGSGFEINTEYAWTIEPAGQGSEIASGTLTTDGDGALCKGALTLEEEHIGGPYKALVNGKNDNFSVVEGQTPTTGTITIEKTTTPGEGGPFDFSIDFLGGSFADAFSLSDGESTDFLSLDIGTYEVTETPDAEWDLSDISCTGATESGVSDITNGVSITLAADETIVCTFTNSQEIEPPVTECNDEIDNDGDGAVDLDDSGCDSSEDDDENTAPIITLLGSGVIDMIVNNAFTDPGATANDEEDGDISGDIVVGGDTVNTTVIGTYVLTYNVSDSDGADASEVTRTINVNPAVTECNDGIDNDGDEAVDLDDSGCESAEDNDENSAPVITLTGDATVTITEGVSYSDAGATANDEEDGDISGDIVVGGDAVDTNTPGTYTITYDVTDSDGATADQVTRTVVVEEDTTVVTECNDGVDNDGDEAVDLDDSGCENSEDDDENTPPTITLLGDNIIDMIINTVFSDPGATATDEEDGDISGDIVFGGSVNAGALGVYTLTYNVTDSDGAAATEVTRTVNVNPVVTECNDGVDNDGDEAVDLDDSGCDSSEDNDENSNPEITLNGNSTVTITEGDSYSDEGATATDEEDGDISGDIIVGGDTVDTNTPGTYVITYNVTDSDGAAATEVTRTVIVEESQNNGGGDPTDVCPNIDGDQEVVPDGYEKNDAGNCVEIQDDEEDQDPTPPTTGGGPSGYIPQTPSTQGQVLGASTEACVPQFDAYLRKGDKGPEVAEIQSFLNTQMNAGLVVDGIFGKNTKNAVAAFQKLYFNEIIMPWVPPLKPVVTGRWYKTTRFKANEILGCSEDPIFLEDPKIFFPAVS